MPQISKYPAAGRLDGSERVLLDQAGSTKTCAASELYGAGGIPVFNVRNYGAKGDGTTDDWAACQAAHDAILATGRASVLYFPANTGSGSYRLSQPLKIRVPGLHILGDGRWNGSRIEGVTSAGNYPLLYARVAPATNWTLGTALATGAGGSLTLSPATAATQPFVNWCESSVFLNGLTAFTAECFIKLTALVDGDFLSSAGKIVYGDPTDTAFRLVYVNGKITGLLTTTAEANKAVVGTTVLSTGVTYHLELSWNGTTLRLFVNGVQEASVALAGTLVQKGHEYGNIGALRYSFAIGIIGDPITGSLDSIHLSDTARHTANFTAPTAKHAFDGNTLLLQNFDDDDVDFTRCMHRNVFNETVPVWLPKSVASTYLNYIEIGHLELRGRAGQGLWISSSWQTYLHDLYVTGGVVGINCAQDQFNSVFERIELVDGLGAPGGRYGFLGQFNVGETFKAFSIQGYHYPFALIGAGTGTIESIYTHGDSDLPIVLSGATGGNAFELIGALISNEDVTLPQRALVAFNNCPTATVLGGNFEAWANAKPAFVISGGYSHVFISPNVRLHASATQAIEIKTVPALTPRLLGGSKQDTPAIPWSLGTITIL